MIGIDISDQSIKVVQLSDDGRRRLVSHCMHMLPAGIVVSGVVVNQQEMEKELVTALGSCSIGNYKKGAVVVSIPENQSFLRVIEMPLMADDEVSEAIRWEIAQHIPFSVDSVYIDWQALQDMGHANNPEKREIQVGAAQKKVVDPLYSVMSSVGLDVAAFELESQAIVRALISPALHRKQGVLIVDIGSTSTNVIVHDVGASRFTASLQRGVSHLASKMGLEDQKKLMENLDEIPPDLMQRITPVIAPELDSLVVDIRGVVDFYNSIDAQHRVQEVILTGGGSGLPGLDESFLHHFDDIHIQRGNPWVTMLSGVAGTRLPMTVQQSVRYATAIGLALRHVVPL